MDQAALVINWEPILWAAGIILTVFFSIISGLLVWIGRLYKGTSERIEVRITAHDDHFQKNDAAIHELALSNREILTIMKTRMKIK